MTKHVVHQKTKVEEEDNAKYLRDELYERIQKEPELFDWLQQSSIDGLFYWDLVNPENEWMSKEFKELFGYEDSEVPNTSTWWQTNIFPEDKEAALVAFEKHVGPERVFYDQVVRYKHKTGKTIWVRCRGQASFDDNGKPIRMLGAHNDITNLMRAQEELKSDLKMRDAALDVLTSTALDGYFDWDIATGYEFLSDRWKICLGYEPEEIQDLHSAWQALLHPDDRTKAQDAIDKHLNEGAPYNIVLRYRRKDGKYAYMRAQGVAQRDAKSGEWLRMFGTHTDVTDLEEARSAARAANLAKSTFLATMSHEIRTPLNAVLGMAQSVLGTQLTEEQRDDLTTLRNAGTHLLSLLNDLLDFSQIEAGHLSIADEQFNIQETCASVLDVCLGGADKKGVGLTLDTRIPAGSSFNGDSDRVRQIVFNLVGNAVKFTDTGSVDVLLEPLERDGILGAAIHVSDTGVGMLPEQQKRVFEDFAQACVETRKRYGGSGLGLSICQKLVAAMNGFIELKSEIGVGSTFTVWIPGLEISSDGQLLDGLALPIQLFEPGDGQPFVRMLELTKCPMKHHCDLESLKTSVNDNSTVLVGRRGSLDGEVFGYLASTKSRIVVVGRGSQTVLSDFKKGQVTILNSFPTIDEIADVLSGKLQTRNAVPDLQFDKNAKPLKVLIAEDNLVNQKVLLRLLSSFPCECSVVSNGLEAVNGASEKAYDLILMDRCMPEMDGTEASMLIRQSDPSVPIFALTANATTNSRDECYAAGMTGFLTKPVNLLELTRVIVETIEKRERGSAAPKKSADG